MRHDFWWLFVYDPMGTVAQLRESQMGDGLTSESEPRKQVGDDVLAKRPVWRPNGKYGQHIG